MSWWNRGPKEEVLENQARRRAAELGGRLEKLPPVAGVKYRPDRVFLHPALPPAFLELKRKGEEPTEEQHHTLAAARLAGFVADWADGPERLKEFFDRACSPPLAMAFGIIARHNARKEEENDHSIRKGIPVRPGRNRLRITGAGADGAGAAFGPAATREKP